MPGPMTEEEGPQEVAAWRQRWGLPEEQGIQELTLSDGLRQAFGL